MHFKLPIFDVDIAAQPYIPNWEVISHRFPKLEFFRIDRAQSRVNIKTRHGVVEVYLTNRKRWVEDRSAKRQLMENQLS